MFSVVEGEFHVRDVSGPVLWVIATENTKVCLDFTVDSFGLAIGLGMICGAHPAFYASEAPEFLED